MTYLYSIKIGACTYCGTVMGEDRGKAIRKIKQSFQERFFYTVESLDRALVLMTEITNLDFTFIKAEF